MSPYFLLDPFEFPYYFYRIRRELIYVLSIVVCISSTFCPTLGHHQGRIYYKSDVRKYEDIECLLCLMKFVSTKKMLPIYIYIYIYIYTFKKITNIYIRLRKTKNSHISIHWALYQENLNVHIWMIFCPDGIIPDSGLTGLNLGSIPGRVIPKTLKMVLDTTLLNTQHYKVRFKGKVEQSWEWSSALPYTLV